MRSRNLSTVQAREQPPPPSKHPLNDRTPEGREEILRRMRVVSAKFYAGAISAGCHAFIEFAGLLNEFIAVCQRAEEQDLPWAHANVHGGVYLPFEPHNIDYLNEKLGCIYGLQIAGHKQRGGSSAISAADPGVLTDLELWGGGAEAARPIQIPRACHTSDPLLDAYEDALNAVVRLRMLVAKAPRKGRRANADLRAALHLAARLRGQLDVRDLRAKEAWLDAASDAGALHDSTELERSP